MKHPMVENKKMVSGGSEITKIFEMDPLRALKSIHSPEMARTCLTVVVSKAGQIVENMINLKQ